MSNSYSEPTGLPSEKLELLEALLREGRADFNPFPLSFAQERLWFLHQLEPSPAYNLPAVIRLAGKLDLHSLKLTLDEIVRRHESLRTIFLPLNGRPAQVIIPSLELPLTVIALDERPESERAAAVEEQGREEARHVFDLTQAPLLRAKLLRLGPEEHALLLTMHHIVSDGWSTGVLIREMSALYEAFTSGRPSPLPELRIQYADFAVWQREQLQGDALEEQLAYWKGRLGDAPPVLELPTDKPRPAVVSFRGAKHSLRLPPRLGLELEALGRREGVSLFMVLLAAWQTLLYRYTNQEDISVGSPVANRTEAELEELIGCFVNTLVLRTKLRGDLTFRALLREVREVCLGAYAHQELPFERLVEELQPKRSTSYTPLFQVMLVVQNAPPPTLELGGLRLRWTAGDTGAAKFDLLLTTDLTEQGLDCTLEYRSELFEAGTAGRMLGHFARLLEGVAADPGRRLCELELLGEEERRRLLVEFNDTAAEYPRGVCLHQLFERQAARTPDEVALVCGEERLTYRELNERANRLAHYLQTLGVGAESLVGILLERSTEMLVSLLAVHKAGGAYVPLDPAYPQERLAFTLEDARVAVLLTRRSLLGAGLDPAARVVCFDECGGEFESLPAHDPACATTPENLSHVIYTSGSTGRPKGVAIAHRSASVLLRWAADTFRAEDLSGMLASTSICFDLSVFELFAPLSVGGKVILAENALALPTLPAAGEVTFVNTVPSAMRELVQTGAVPDSTRVVGLAGEALGRALVEEVYACGGVREVWNLYGPTEDTTYSTAALVQRGEGLKVTIGRPVANTSIYIVDGQMRPVPAGVVGDLYISGEGLARGYLNRPALTAERFIPDPFGGRAGARLYKTGDLARYLNDGEIEYLGRSDHQVKVRGFRIELGEIESALAGHACVREAVVVVREEADGDKRLVAYLVATGEPVSRADLTNHLTTKLPRHMIPAAFVFLDALPLTVNGKVDRRALPKPPAAGDTDAGAYVAPRSVKEEALADIWQILLGVERVGVRNDFFELGGNSLLMMQVIARVKKVFDVSLPVAAFYQSPTVESLAEMIRKLQRSPLLEAGLSLARADETPGRHSVIVELQPAGSSPPIFLAHTLGGHLGDCMELAQELGALDQPVYGLQARGLDDDSEPSTRIEEMAASYAEAVLSVQAEGPFRLGGYCSGGLLSFEVAQRLQELGHEVELLALIGAQPTPGGPVSLAEMRQDPEVLPVVAFCGELKIAVGEEALRALDSNGRREKVWEEFCLQSPEYAENLGRPMFERLYRVYVANAVALINNVPRPYAGRVVLFDFMEQQDRLAHRSAWDELCLGPVERHEVPGNHITAMRRPNARLLAQELNACLNAPRRVSLKRNRGARQRRRPDAAS